MFVLMMALVLPVSAAAAADEPTADTSTTPAKPALVINAPDVTIAGQNTKILITERFSGAPVGQAGVWAVGFPALDAASTDIAPDSTSEIETFLGWTDNTGYLIYAFKYAGPYVLVTFKDGYLPGFDRIVVKPADKALAIKAPASAGAGEPVTIIVIDRNTGAGVSLAGVWAVAVSAIPVPTPSTTADSADLIKQYGQFIGSTDDGGKLTFKLDNPDRYLLVATKDTYTPGFARITIQVTKALVIKAPAAVPILAPVTIRVLEKSVLTVEIPVPKAGVWAVRVDDAAALDETSDFPAVANKYGLFLGWTDEQGYVNPAPKFSKPGQYWLIAIKEGYRTGLSQITVKPLETATPTPLPNSTSTTASQAPASLKGIGVNPAASKAKTAKSIVSKILTSD